MGDDGHDRAARHVGFLVRIPEAADLLSIGRSTVYALIVDGHLDTVHIGRAVRVTTASIEAFVERRRSEHRSATQRGHSTTVT